MIEFWALLKGLGTSLELVKEIISGAKSLAQWVEANKNEKWFQDSAELFKGLRAAKTPEEKKHAAEALRDLFRRL